MYILNIKLISIHLFLLGSADIFSLLNWLRGLMLFAATVMKVSHKHDLSNSNKYSFVESASFMKNIVFIFLTLYFIILIQDTYRIHAQIFEGNSNNFVFLFHMKNVLFILSFFLKKEKCFMKKKSQSETQLSNE